VKRVKRLALLASGAGYACFVGVSLLKGYAPGVAMARNLASFSIDMFRVLPCAFVLIGLFEVWVKPQTVERHLGQGSGVRGYFWAVLLAANTVGGVYVAFPVAEALYRKGARWSVILTYVAAAGICRVPMTIFEASFLGLPFSLVRLGVSLPLVILTSALLGRYLDRIGYRMSTVG